MIVAYCGGLRLRNASPGRADAKIPTEQDTAQGADHGALEGGQVGDPSLGHQATHRVVENRQHIGRLLRRWSQTPSHWRWLSKLRPCHTIRQASSRRPILNHTPDEVPHLFICGPSGKTVFVQHLIVSRAGQVVVLDPKWQRGKWGGAPAAHWGYAELAEALDAAARRCGALTERVNTQTAARMRAAEGGAGGLLAGLLLAYVSIAPAGLGLVGESLCLLLRGLLRLARAAGWALGVIWGCAWGEAAGPAAAALARLLLALALVVWLPLASLGDLRPRAALVAVPGRQRGGDHLGQRGALARRRGHPGGAERRAALLHPRRHERRQHLAPGHRRRSRGLGAGVARG